MSVGHSIFFDTMKFLCFIVFNCLCAITVTSDVPSTCTTPNNEKASCVLLTDCPLLLSAVGSKDPDAVKFVQASNCGNFMVCCGTSATFTKNQSEPEPSNGSRKNESSSKDERRDYVLNNLLPKRRYCGLQHTDDYHYFESPFYNSSITSVDEFPWMVYVLGPRGYSFESKLASCVGFLISPKYFLSSGRCFMSSNFFEVGTVAVGQHRIYQDESCIETPYGDDCTNLENQNIESINYHDNIALVRLKTPVRYSDFVRPICLPLEESEMPQTGDILFTSGWGTEDDEEGNDVKIKKRVKHTLMDQSECKKGNPLKNPICGITLENNTNSACSGDNGGPLMYRQKKKTQNWIALGIVDGKSSCAEYEPVVAKRITSDVLEWIIDTIKD